MNTYFPPPARHARGATRLHPCLLVLFLLLACQGLSAAAPQPGIPAQPTVPAAAQANRSAPAAFYYLAPGGDDSNTGSLAEPWRTLQHAAQTIQAGDTVYLRAGVYNEQLAPQHSGAAGAYITYAAYPGENPVIDGSSVDLPEWEGLVNIVGQNYIRIAGLRVINAGPTLHNPGILAEDSSHIIIENNSVSHTSDSGIAAWSSQDVLVAGNEVEDSCYNLYNESISIGGTDGFEVHNNHVHNSIKEGICLKDGSSNGSAHHNRMHDVKIGVYVDAWDKHTFNIDVYANIAYQTAADGYAVASEMGGLLQNVHLYNNIAYQSTFCGFNLSLNGDSPSHPMQDIIFINNTLYNNGAEWGGGICIGNGEAQGVIIRNNLLSQNLSFQFADEEGLQMGKMLADHNLIDGFRDYPGELYGDDPVTGSPAFANPAAADFHLQAASPAIDAASSLLAPGADFDGLARPLDGDQDGAALPDIGAYEFNPGGSLTHWVYLPVIATD